MLFGWFNTKEAALMGVKLAEELSEELIKVNSKLGKKEMIGRDKAIKKFFSKLDQFKQNQQLNFYKKSKLVNEFRWKLLELRHDEDFVEMITKELMIHIN